MTYDLILVAAGEGQRAALGYNKVLYKINGKKELIKYSLEFFLNDKNCSKIVVVINERDEDYLRNLAKEYGDDRISFAYGGGTRSESVYSGLKESTGDYVLIHDAARPLLYKEDIINLLNEAKETGGATLATKVYNTTCHIENGYVENYFSRHTLASLITPQCFNATRLLRAYHASVSSGLNFTDDTSIFKACGNSVRLVFTDNISIKATTPYDIKLLEVLLDANR